MKGASQPGEHRLSGLADGLFVEVLSIMLVLFTSSAPCTLKIVGQTVFSNHSNRSKRFLMAKLFEKGRKLPHA